MITSLSSCKLIVFMLEPKIKIKLHTAFNNDEIN